MQLIEPPVCPAETFFRQTSTVELRHDNQQSQAIFSEPLTISTIQERDVLIVLAIPAVWNHQRGAKTQFRLLNNGQEIIKRVFRLRDFDQRQDISVARIIRLPAGVHQITADWAVDSNISVIDGERTTVLTVQFL